MRRFPRKLLLPGKWHTHWTRLLQQLSSKCPLGKLYMTRFRCGCYIDPSDNSNNSQNFQGLNIGPWRTGYKRNSIYSCLEGIRQEKESKL